VTCESFEDGEIKKPARVILNEGLYVLNEGLRDIMDIKVYVFTPLNILRDRWYKRAESRGKTGLAADLQFRDVNKTAQQYIRPTMKIADVIINGLVEIDYIEIITDKIFSTIDAIC
jgi:uridine kinase